MIPKEIFPDMLQAIPSMTQRVVSTLLDRVREVTRIEQQAEKLSALGKLAGNLAHELNNPASAAQSAAASLAEALTANRANRFKYVQPPPERGIRCEDIEEWEETIICTRRCACQATSRMPSAFIEREESIRTWLGGINCPIPWEVAPQLAEQGVTTADLDKLRAVLEGESETCITLQYFARYLRASRSVQTLAHSTGAHLRSHRRGQGLLQHGPRAHSRSRCAGRPRCDAANAAEPHDKGRMWSAITSRACRASTPTAAN